MHTIEDELGTFDGTFDVTPDGWTMGADGSRVRDWVPAA